MLVFCGCKSTSKLNFDVLNLELQKPIKYVFDEKNNIIEIDKTEMDNPVTIKIIPPSNLKDLSEVRVWCNDIPFVNSSMFYSNGKQIYITLPKTKRTTTTISVKWTFNSKKQEYIVLFKNFK